MPVVPSSDSRLTSYRWLILAAATASQASASFATQGLAALAGFLQMDLQLTTTEVGLLFTAIGLAPIVTLLFVGDLLDRQSERVIIGIGTIIISCGLVAATLTRSFAMLLAALFIIGIGYSTIQPGGSRSVSKWFHSNQLGMAMGVRQAGLPLGGAAAAVALPFIVGLRDWRAAILFSAFIVLLGGALFWFVYRPPGLTNKRRGRSVLSAAYLIAIVRQKWMRRVIWSGLALAGSQCGIVVYLMLFLRDRLGMPLYQGAFFLFLVQLFGGAGRILLSTWSDRCGKSGKRFFPVSVSMISTVLGLLALIHLPTQAPVFMLVCVVGWLGFFALGWYGPWVTYVADSSPQDSVGLALGAAMTVTQIAIVSAPPLLGMVYDFTQNYDYLWYSLVAWIAVAGWVIRPRRSDSLEGVDRL